LQVTTCHAPDRSVLRDGIVEQAFGEECDGGSNCKDCRYIND
jgi:hypothetical protein